MSWETGKADMEDKNGQACFEPRLLFTSLWRASTLHHSLALLRNPQSLRLYCAPPYKVWILPKVLFTAPVAHGVPTSE